MKSKVCMIVWFCSSFILCMEIQKDEFGIAPQKPVSWTTFLGNTVSGMNIGAAIAHSIRVFDQDLPYASDYFKFGAVNSTFSALMPRSSSVGITAILSLTNGYQMVLDTFLAMYVLDGSEQWRTIARALVSGTNTAYYTGLTVYAIFDKINELKNKKNI